MAKVISFFKPQSPFQTNINNLKDVLSTSSEEERASSYHIDRIVSIMREWTSAVFNQIDREHFSAGHTNVVFEYDDNTMVINTKQSNALKIQSTSLGVQQIQHNVKNSLPHVTDQNKVFAPNPITSTSPKKTVNAFLLDYKDLIALPDAHFEDAMNRIYSRLCKLTHLTPIKGNIFPTCFLVHSSMNGIKMFTL